MDTYLAQLLLFAGNFEIRGFSYCMGQILSISQNTALFSLLGTTYGGNGQTTFALPDLRGRTPIGFGQGPGLQSYALGQIGGTETTTLTIANMPTHNHSADASTLTILPSASTAAATTNIPASTLVPAKLPVLGGGPSATAINGYAPKDNSATLASSDVSGGITVGMQGGSQPFASRDPYLAMTYIIAVQGIFPSRN
jgi:microcystin-dependent protein